MGYKRTTPDFSDSKEEEAEAALLKAAEQAAKSSREVKPEERRKQAKKAADQRIKSEAETRYLIDEELRKVGWEADTERLRYAKGSVRDHFPELDFSECLHPGRIRRRDSAEKRCVHGGRNSIYHFPDQ